jgi:hypothetical protein
LRHTCEVKSYWVGPPGSEPGRIRDHNQAETQTEGGLRYKRFHLHFIQTSSSWLNLVERWFREATDMHLRRGAFPSVPELIAAIQDYMNNRRLRLFGNRCFRNVSFSAVPCGHVLKTFILDVTAVT